MHGYQGSHFVLCKEAVFLSEVKSIRNVLKSIPLQETIPCYRRLPAPLSSMGEGRKLILFIFLPPAGLDMLTNIQRGHVYGEVCGWRMCKRRKLGVHLLHKAFRAYLLDTPQEVFQHDL